MSDTVRSLRLGANDIAITLTLQFYLNQLRLLDEYCQEAC